MSLSTIFCLRTTGGFHNRHLEASVKDGRRKTNRLLSSLKNAMSFEKNSNWAIHDHKCGVYFLHDLLFSNEILTYIFTGNSTVHEYVLCHALHKVRQKEVNHNCIAPTDKLADRID